MNTNINMYTRRASTESISGAEVWYIDWDTDRDTCVHIRGPGFESQNHFWFQVPANGTPGRQQWQRKCSDPLYPYKRIALSSRFLALVCLSFHLFIIKKKIHFWKAELYIEGEHEWQTEQLSSICWLISQNAVKARAGTHQSKKLGVWPVVSHMDAKSQGLGSLLNAFPGALVGSWMGVGAPEMSWCPCGMSVSQVAA